MAYITFKNMEEYQAKINKLAKKSKALCKQVVYDGTGVMADAMKEALRDLPIEEGKNGLPPYAPPGGKLTGVSTKQRNDLIDSMGVTKISEDRGYIYAKIGWDGYGSVKTKRWPKGVPNVLLMRSIEAGTRFRVKKPIVRQTINKNKSKTLKKMQNTTDEILEKEFK